MPYSKTIQDPHTPTAAVAEPLFEEPAPPSTTLKLLAVLGVVLALWIFIVTLIVVRAGWVAIPVADDWDRWDTYVLDHYTPSWFFREHVDHRLVVPKILFALDHLVFRGRGWSLLVLTLFLQGLTGFLLWRLAFRGYRQDRSESVLLAAFIAACVFSAQQWMNLIFPFQIQFPLVYCFSVAALCAIRESYERRWNTAWLTASIGLAILATYSMANGILIWPVMLLAAVWLRMPRRWLLTIAGSAAFIGVTYFYDWHKFSPTIPMPFAERLIRSVVFWFGNLGSPVVALAMLRDSLSFRIIFAAIPGVLLLLALAAAFVMIWRRREHYSSGRAMLVFFGVFLAITGATIAYGRATGDMLEIYSSRYLTPGYLFWITMLLAGWPLLRRFPRVPLYAGICAAMLVGIAIHQRAMLISTIHDRATLERLGEVAVVDNVTDPEPWRMLYHTPKLTLDAINYLRDNRLTLFTEEWTHWPGVPLNRRFSIDRTPGACEGQFDEVMPVVSVVRPGWRITGWAWDNRSHQSPRYIILSDDSGLVAGVGLSGFDLPPALAALSARNTAATWKGYISGEPRPITAYALEADQRSVCPIGKVEVHRSGKEVDFKAFGPRLGPDATPEIAGAWVPDGYFKGSGGPGAAPVEGPVYGSFPDANTGTIRIGPFHLDGHTEIAIPLVTGPDNHGLTLTVRDAVTKGVLAQMDPMPVRDAWWAWHPDLPNGQELNIEVVASDKGSGWGQWFAVGWPHELKK